MTDLMLDLAIRYNQERGFEDAALALARRLFAQYDEAIGALTLIPVPDEDFSLYLNGVLLCSQREAGRAPLVADVKAALRGEDHPIPLSPQGLEDGC